jgi:hypothetical protein
MNWGFVTPQSVMRHALPHNVNRCTWFNVSIQQPGSGANPDCRWNKIAGLMQWKDHVPRSDESYCLKHLHPIDFTHDMPASKQHPAVTVKIHVAFGLHTFTRDIKANEPPEDDYSDNREKRCFDYERYKHSHRLPAIVREIPTCRNLYFSRTRSGLINYATFDTQAYARRLKLPFGTASVTC